MPPFGAVADDVRAVFIGGYGLEQIAPKYPQLYYVAAPDWATRLMERVEAKPDGRMADSDLRDMDIDPATARRFFQSQFGMTFQGFQRARRLGRALAMIRAGESTTAAAIDNGFESPHYRIGN